MQRTLERSQATTAPVSAVIHRNASPTYPTSEKLGVPEHQAFKSGVLLEPSIAGCVCVWGVIPTLRRSPIYRTDVTQATAGKSVML